MIPYYIDQGKLENYHFPYIKKYRLLPLRRHDQKSTVKIHRAQIFKYQKEKETES